jgi:uncharacterized Tic20 family protein
MNISSSERNWAMMAHLLTFLGFTSWLGGFFRPGYLLFGWHFLAPLFIYAISRNRSYFVSFHALQSFYFQLLVAVTSLGLLAVAGIVAFFTCGLGLLALAPFLRAFPFVVAIYVLIAGIRANKGDWYEYIVVGRPAREAIRIY